MLTGGTARTGPGRRRRLLTRGVALAVALAAGTGVAVAVAGSGGLDPSFGKAGTTVFERPTSTYPTPVGLTAGGKIVAVTTEGGVITVSRFLADGSPDPSFDGDGTATIEEPGNYPSAYGAAIQPDGKIVLVGFKNLPESEEAAMVWRLKADGGSGATNDALDPSFGTGGRVALKPDTANVANAVLVQPDGKIDVTGYIFNVPGGKKTAAVWRLDSAGSLDKSFDTDGLAEITDAHEDDGVAIALAAGGKVVIAGTTTNASNPPDVAVWRLEANGSRDLSFDVDGQADIDSGGEDSARGVAVQPDNRIVVVGRSDLPKSSRAMIWRLKANGGPEDVTSDALDPTFDTDGAAELDGGGFADATAVALQPDGKILVSGYAQPTGGQSAAVLWRIEENGGSGAVNGALDPSFGSGGATTVKVGATSGAQSLALAPDRRVVVAGQNFEGNLLLFRALGDPFTLKVATSGTGAGTVQSGPAGIACGSACTAPFDDGSTVTLTPAPAGGSAFAGWSGGGCTGTGSCTVTMSSDQTVTGTFNRVLPLPPKITGLSESNSVFRAGPSSTSLTGHTAARGHRRGTVFSFRLDRAATVKLAITRRAKGRRVGHRCVPATRRLRSKRACTRNITVATLTRSAQAGLNRLPFSGRLRSRALAPTRYEAVFTAADSAGVSAARALAFKVVRR